MNEEEFITKFYSCDDEEQFLKDVYHNLNYLQQEKQQLKIQISAREEEYRKLENKVNKIIETIDEELIYDKGTDITSAIGDVGEKMKFYLSDCEFLNEFRKLERGVSDENNNI